MNRKIEWRSMELDEIELVYEKAENNHNIETLLEQLETQALEEAKNNMGMLKTDTGNVLKPEQFESLSDTDKETVKDESENNRPYEYSEGMPSKGFGLPKELAAVLPNPDRIIITSFSSAGNTFGTRMRFGFGMNGMNDIYKAQNFIQYRCKRSKNSEQAQNCTSLFADSFHPFVQRYANDISGSVENILHSIMYTPISYELTDGILNVCLDSGYQETYYQETSEYIRFNDRYQESFHDGGGNGCGFQIDVDTEMFQHLIIFKKGQQRDQENGSRQKPTSQIYQPKDSDDTDDRCDHTHFHFLSSVSPPKRRSLPVNQSIAFESSSSVKSGHRTGVKYSSP